MKTSLSNSPVCNNNRMKDRKAESSASFQVLLFIEDSSSVQIGLVHNHEDYEMIGLDVV